MEGLREDQYLNEYEARELERILTKYQSTDVRDVLMIETAYRTGARASEILKLTRKSLVYLNGISGVKIPAIKFKTLKGGNDRTVVVRDEFMIRLLAYAESIEPSKRLFPITLRTMQNAWYKFKPVDKRLHSLRHTYADRLFILTGNLPAVAQDLGHKNINSTVRYVHKKITADEKMKLVV